MKKLLIIMFMITSTAFACDGTCQCGGKPAPTTASVAVSFGTNVIIGVVGGATIGAVPTVALFGIRALLGPVYRSQRAYNKAHGIIHSRSNRRKR